MLGVDVFRLFTLDQVGTSPPPCLGLLKRSEGLINEVNFSERTDQCVLISFVRFGSVRKRRLTCEICSLISCSI